jgi:hypothetical protein
MTISAAKLARIVRDRFSTGGPKAADALCDRIERVLGRRKLDDVFEELQLILEAELGAHRARSCSVVTIH